MNRMQAAIKVQAAALASRLKAVLTEPAPAKVRYQRRGRVDRKLIGSLATGVRDDVLQRRKVRPGTNPPRVLIAVDHSTSMAGSRTWVVGNAIDVWVQALKRAGLPYAVSFWGDADGTLYNTARNLAYHEAREENAIQAEAATLRVAKDFNQPHQTGLDGLWVGVLQDNLSGGTPTQASLVAAVDYACQGAAHDQAVIVVFFTDGEPNNGTQADHMWIHRYITAQEAMGIHIIPVVYAMKNKDTGLVVSPYQGQSGWPNTILVTAEDIATRVGTMLGNHVKHVVKSR